MTTNVSRRTLPQKMVGIALWLAVLGVFAPSLLWITEVAVARAQLRDAAVVLLFGVIFLIRDRREPARWVLEFSRRTGFFVSGACLAAAASSVLHQPFLMMAAMGLLAGGLLLFLFGDEVAGLATGLAFSFSVFTFLAVVSPVADVPLRVFAGKATMGALDLFGAGAALGFLGDSAKLILMVNGRPFEVAPECNGFGITSSCLLLACLLATSRRLRWLDRSLMIVLAPLIGIFSNTLRIIIIVLLAPAVGSSGYHVMHEAVGIVLFLSTLFFIWWLVAGLPERKTAPPQIKSAIS